MDRRRMIVASCLSLAFAMAVSACAVFSSAPPGMSEEPQGPLRLSFEELSEPVLAYMSEDKTLEELAETLEAVNGASCREDIFREDDTPKGRDCSDGSFVLIFDSANEHLRTFEDIDEYSKAMDWEEYRLVGTTWSLAGEPERLEELHQELGGVLVHLGG